MSWSVNNLLPGESDETYLTISNVGKKEVNVDFIKTSTGFSEYGARVEDVELINKYKKDNISIKASGGVRTYDDAINMINAGATRIGTSNGVNIVNDES